MYNYDEFPRNLMYVASRNFIKCHDKPRATKKTTCRRLGSDEINGSLRTFFRRVEQREVKLLAILETLLMLVCMYEGEGEEK